jgi:hemerythrin-like metal-binding protein
MPEELEFIKLQKEVKILKKKLARSETNRVTLEEMWDRNSHLFQTFNNEIEQQGKLIQEKNEQLEGLAAKLAKYLSPQVYDSIFTGEREVKIETYRKPLTVFFSDIVGFTTKSENMKTEELSIWLNDYLHRMAEIAIQYEGTLDKFIGDAVLVFFGDPKTSGEKIDAFNCTAMAMAMRQEAKKLGVDIRIGINSGLATVGNFGSENRMEYTVIGKVVNLASRLESNSKPGQILISESTYQLLENMIRCEEREEIRVKGIDKDIKTYWVVEDLRDVKPLWNDTFLTHVSNIDQQHKELFRRTELFMKAMVQRKGSEQIKETLSFLDQYTKEHFREEEGFMLQHKYPDYPEHKALHTKFIEDLNILTKAPINCESESMQCLVGIHKLIINGLFDHIKYTDTKISKFLIEKALTVE